MYISLKSTKKLGAHPILLLCYWHVVSSFMKHSFLHSHRKHSKQEWCINQSGDALLCHSYSKAPWFLGEGRTIKTMLNNQHFLKIGILTSNPKMTLWKSTIMNEFYLSFSQQNVLKCYIMNRIWTTLHGRWILYFYGHDPNSLGLILEVYAEDQCFKLWDATFSFRFLFSPEGLRNSYWWDEPPNKNGGLELNTPTILMNSFEVH